MDLLVLGALLLAVAFALVLGYRWLRGKFRSQGRLSPETAAPATLSDGLAPTRRGLGDRLNAVFKRSGVDEDMYEGLEEALLSADLGVSPTLEVLDRVREAQPASPSDARERLQGELLNLFGQRDRSLKAAGQPAVIVVVGVNGSGKTTTVAKLAHRLRAEGLNPLLGAADTFRAAGDVQLQQWADRLGMDVVAGAHMADPASVAFDAYQAARARGRDVAIIDTAGRLHSKHNLMQELGKIVRVLRGEAGEVDEVLLVLDATGGQNGLAQTREFASAAGVTGIVLTKLDGTARGGVVAAAESAFDVPVKFVGVGEDLDDLIPFEPEEFVSALLGDT